MKKNTYIGLGLFFVFIFGAYAGSAQSKPWRLVRILAFPDGLQVSGEHRTRYETLDGQYRAVINGQPADGGDQALVFRTLIHTRVNLDSFSFGAEMLDSRVDRVDSGSATSSSGLTTTIANPLELLQAYIEVPLGQLFFSGSQSVIRGGRITLDVGSRRLVARNRYRNTINAFTGLDWKGKIGDKNLRVFYTLPIERKVAGDIRNNHAQFDQENIEVRFWGLYYSQPLLNARDQSEIFVFGLNERDTENRATKNRNLYTFGIRFWRKPKSERFDFQLETVYQSGQSRTSLLSTTTLDHWAYFHHAELGYSFNTVWYPRMRVQFDYASGDDDPNDGQNNRFDTLYGARRFDFGPTSLYGAFARSNLISPALRLQMKAGAFIKPMFSLRGFWRASTTDSWTTAGIDGRQAYIGTQLEARLRWEPLSGNMQIEGGVAYLFAGDLMKQAGKNNTHYAYTQVTVKF